MSAQPITAAAAKPLPAPKDQRVPVSVIRESKLNARKEYSTADMADLTASVQEKGVLTALWLHDVGPHMEIIAGSRRLRAAIGAKLEYVPARVYAGLNEDQLLELQIIENLQRRDLSPLEEATAIAALLKRGHSAKEVGTRIGKDARYVHRVAVLADLPAPAREMVEADALPITSAIELMRIADPDRRNQAAQALVKSLKELQRYRPEDTMSEHDAARTLRPYFLELKTAPFDTSDATLSAAGACGPCPFRTGNQAALFGADGDQDVCTKPSCFSDKTKAHQANIGGQAKALGFAVASGAQLEKVYPERYGRYEPAKGYVDLDDKPSYDARKTYRQLIGGEKGFAQVTPDAVTLVFHPTDGRPVHLVREPEVLRLAKAAGNEAVLKRSKPSSSSSKSRSTSTSTSAAEKAAAAKRKEEEAVQKITQARALDRVMKSIEAQGPRDADWRLVLGQMIAVSDNIGTVAHRRGLLPESTDPADYKAHGAAEKALLALVAKAPGRHLQALIIELTLADLDDYGISGSPRLRDVVKGYGLDMKKIEAEVRSERKAAAEKAAAPIPAKKKPVTAKAKK